VNSVHVYNIDTKTLKDDLPSTPTPAVAVGVKIVVSTNRWLSSRILFHIDIIEL